MLRSVAEGTQFWLRGRCARDGVSASSVVVTWVLGGAGMSPGMSSRRASSTMESPLGKAGE